MKAPLSWLKDYVDITETPQQVADRLTFAGIEVEGIETIGAAYDGMIVGDVRTVEKHPNADKLSVCRVFDGEQELQVVCGAPNVKAGGKYPFAPAGVTMPDGTKIKQAKLRGVESFGMLCSEVELKLSDDHAGLMTLDAAIAPGTPLAEVLGPPETVFDLEITPNRPDCLSLIGVARELAAMYRRQVKLPQVDPPPDTRHSPLVTVEDFAACPRYTARILDGVQIGPSPAWMQNRLKLAGIRPINNVVDITNYVMIECGQPLHAFDQSLLKEGRIVVRRARAGEKMATLDGIDRELDPAMLVIADAEHPVALAGVMGGAGSEIRDTTQTVLLESACFKANDIRATSRKIGLSTESSYRFERGVDIGGVEWASRRAAALMAEHAGATIVPGVVDVYPAPPQPRKILCRFDTIRSVSGVEASNDDITGLFQALELGVEKGDATSCTVIAPSFRGDLESEVDLVEEFARVHGLDKIPTPTPRAQIDAGDDRASKALGLLRSHLVALGLQEIMNYSLVSENLLDLFDASDKAVRIVLPNPVSADQSILRPSLVPQVVETLGRNRARQIDAAALFEIGRVFSREGEHTALCIGLMGPVGRDHLNRRKPVQDEEQFLWLKGIWESLARAQQLADWSMADASRPCFKAGQTVSISAGGAVIGELGIVKEAVRKEWRLTDPVAVLTVRVEPLLRNAFAPRVYAAIPPYPCVVRDIAMIVSDRVRNADIERIIRQAAPAELERVRIFDIFSGESIGRGRKSVAYSLTYRSGSRTLTDEEANGYHNRVKDALKQSLEIEIREG
ncbi:MAG: phenylalanine--tRNA ligase subunit beta [bacterium]